MSMSVVIRAVLGAVWIVTFFPGVFAVLGGYFPDAAIVGPFGLVLNTGFSWLLIDMALSSALVGLVVALGGKKAKLLLVINLVFVGATAYIGYRYASFAADNGARYDVVRALDGFPPIKDAHQKVTFATFEGKALQAELWFPDGAKTAAPDSLGAVVFVHGGAFLAGFPGTRPMMMEAIAKAGFVGVDIDYRVAPPPRWNQAPADVLCAMAWVGSAAEFAMVDPKRVVIVGESAGGNLALVAGYAAGTDTIASSCPERGAPIVPAGIFAVAPTIDLTGIWHDRSIFDFDGSQFPETYIGGTPDQFPERYAAAEPFRLLRPTLPPALILSGEIDHFVLIERQVASVERLRAGGADVRLLIAPFAGHGFDGEPASFGAQLAEVLVPSFARDVTD
jgi:acetyl esterase/lipase